MIQLLGTYETVKVVQLKDKRLACFRALTLLGILGYTLFQLFMSHQYAKFVRPIGQVNVEFLPPAINFTTDLPYCLNSLNTSSDYPEPFECEVWDDLEFVRGAVPSSTFITSHVNISQQTKNNCGSGCSSPWSTTAPPSNIYISQIEDYTIKLTTTFEAQKTSQTDSYGNMTYYLQGKLVDKAGDTVKSFKHNESDQFTLSNLFQAAGLNDGGIDTVSDWTYNERFNYTYRTWGMLLVVSAEFNNRVGGLLGEPTYTYSVNKIPNKKYLIREIVEQDGANRTVYDRYGVQVIFTVEGDIGFFDFQTLLLTLVGASALLSVSTIIVEFVMLRVLSNKEKYKECKYDVVSIADRPYSAFGDSI